ncbi:tyrosine-type recombinase/integrase [Photobacterium damselae subsp. damselae]|uniref:Tyrosine-type recombinase/integrase n=1 Tax=Photobacterium damselae subsp. damselae TaxID=85581 RepID=A0A850QZZ0_PHODD|nr:tyrosine-type recombinase/integrase [Photobacterium damselae subsp. damselae]
MRKGRIDVLLSESDSDSKRGVKTKSKPPKNKKQLIQIIDAVYAKNCILSYTLLTQVYTGLRYSDASNLFWRDVYNFETEMYKQSFEVTQQKVYRMVYQRAINSGYQHSIAKSKALKKAVYTVYISPALIELLEDVAIINKKSAGNTFIFANQNPRSKGNPLAIQSISKILKAVQRELKLEFSLGTHSFRHFFSDEALRSGAKINTLKGLLGHNSITSTNAYINSDEDSKQNIILKQKSYV